MPAVSLSVAKLRDLNAALHKLPKDTNETHWVITDPGGKHAIACGVNLPITIEIMGHVGYYCGGMNSQATIVINGNAGAGGGEHDVGRSAKGDASQPAGASAAGPSIEGNASARCGISMKGIDIVVKGSIGAMSAFMAQSETSSLGDAGEALRL